MEGRKEEGKEWQVSRAYRGKHDDDIFLRMIYDVGGEATFSYAHRNTDDSYADPLRIMELPPRITNFQ